MRVAVSGTYSTGKTTTTLALANLTGINRTHAKTMREILPEAFPGKKLEECTAAELFQLGIRRYAERVVHESHLTDFISDGSSIHEWIYGQVRLEVGINPNDPNSKITSTELKTTQDMIQQLGQVVKDHAKKNYDSFIHLPVEFPIKEDGHRPVSEEFRNKSDELLIKTLDELQIEYYVVGGTIEERLKKILVLYDEFPQVMSIEQAISLANEEVKAYQIEIEEIFYAP
ncbi:AAA family ATPase [Enterococcus casseliflavus]